MYFCFYRIRGRLVAMVRYGGNHLSSYQHDDSGVHSRLDVFWPLCRSEIRGLNAEVDAESHVTHAMQRC